MIICYWLCNFLGPTLHNQSMARNMD